MSDIVIFSTWDIIVMILVACAPGLVIGAGIGAWVGAGKNPGRRLKGATVFGLDRVRTGLCRLVALSDGYQVRPIRVTRHTLLAALVAACSALAAQPALAWTAAEQVKTYPVYGKSGPELYESIGQNGPVISGDRRTIAHTTFKLTWGRDYRERADGSCV